MIAFVFVVAMVIPTFGGPVLVSFQTTDLESCLKFRKVVEKEMTGMSMKFTMTQCEAKP